MKKSLFHGVLTTVFFTGFFQAVRSQSFLNGSFETTTASMACNYNLGNGTFNSLMSNSFAYGTGNEIDILVNGCFTTGIPDGVRAIGLAATYDQVSLELSAPLVAGNSYTISFWTYGQTDFRPLGNLELGLSTVNNAFGTSIGVANTVAMTWTNHSITFIAPNNGTHITVRNAQDGIIHWNHVDHFEFVSVLPVELINFNAVPEGQFVNVTWQTLSERDSDSFTIERSDDLMNWEYVDRIQSLGNSNSLTDYQYIDRFPLSNTSYYRLIQIDRNGQQTRSEVRTVRFSEEHSILISSNPSVDGRVILSTSGVTGEVVVRSSDGRVVHRSSQIDRVELILSSGIYYVEYENNGKINKQKLLVL